MSRLSQNVWRDSLLLNHHGTLGCWLDRLLQQRLSHRGALDIAELSSAGSVISLLYGHIVENNTKLKSLIMEDSSAWGADFLNIDFHHVDSNSDHKSMALGEDYNISPTSTFQKQGHFDEFE